MKFPRPKNRKNVPEFAKIAKPLNNLLKKDVTFKWTQDVQLFFENFKKILCSAPVLQYPDFSRPFVVTVDASDFAMGAILSQGPIGRDLPIAYASCALHGA